MMQQRIGFHMLLLLLLMLLLLLLLVVVHDGKIKKSLCYEWAQIDHGLESPAS